MNRYELTYIIDIGLEENARKELIEKFSGLIRQNGGEVEKVDEMWGKRRLAYPINDMLEGYYVLVTFMSEGDLPREIERNLEINDNILRYLTIKLVEKKQSVKPRPVRMPAPVAPPADVVAETPVAPVETPVVPAESSVAPAEIPAAPVESPVVAEVVEVAEAVVADAVSEEPVEAVAVEEVTETPAE